MIRIQRPREARPTAGLRRILCVLPLAFALPCLAQAEPAATWRPSGGDVASVPAANLATAGTQTRKKLAARCR